MEPDFSCFGGVRGGIEAHTSIHAPNKNAPLRHIAGKASREFQEELDRRFIVAQRILHPRFGSWKKGPVLSHLVARDSSSLLSEEQLLCSICLDVFTDPVTTPCGHNFCKSCLTQCWEGNQHCYCPLCKEKFTKKPELKINTTLREVADHFKKKSVPDKPEVLCDVCTGEKVKAVKSCLDCGLTFCKSHLEPHNHVPKLTKHILINPVENLEDYICQKHERALELFCRDDQTCVCQFCTEGDHKNHNTVPIEEEIRVMKTQLGKTQTDVRQMIQDRLEKIQKFKQSVELSKRNTEKEKADSVEVFTALIRSIERSQAELLKLMEEKQKAAEMQAEELIKELEQEVTVLQRRDTELQKLSHTEDHLHLLQVYSSMFSLPHKNWTEISINTDLSGDTVRTSLSQLQHSLNEKLSKTLNDKLMEAELKRMQQYAVYVILDPDTAHPKLIISADGKQVSHGDKRQNLPDTPERFDKCPCVLGKQSFSSGRFYYEVQVSGKTKWDLGVVSKNINRKWKIIEIPQNGFWTVRLRNKNQYEALAVPPVPLTLREKVEKVGVFVDYEEGLVSFYDVNSRSHIYSFTGQTFTEKLYPFFSPCSNNGGKNSAPMIISPLL
ncbi:E3 ubiquitin-protein ligase TRIM39 [Silurus asotus]|uniref:E3 ubiquitin-protein ligase TRIM39 n=1 Tax=Silurus asotus TaxID=30991 RepID=A0AAD5B249_SILAS|nr:E3 ubiquitin-protein ligase TRIM39 [Silurus asotus]